jgi:hypothetical protein
LVLPVSRSISVPGKPADAARVTAGHGDVRKTCTVNERRGGANSNNGRLTTPSRLRVNNDLFGAFLVQNEDQAAERVDPAIFSWPIELRDRI